MVMLHIKLNGITKCSNMVENNSLAELSCYELSSLIFKEYQPRGQAYCWAQEGGGAQCYANTISSLVLDSLFIIIN